MVIFVLNILLNLEEMWENFCECTNNNHNNLCLIC